ncbi:MAG: glycosyltransferase family 2 protein [Alistipes sp.]|nr:glycosyltransferase family 2 protein [Alistipes sp.]
MIRLSLIIATYNRAAQLLTTLRSVAEQSARGELWECIIVDNNSTDDTRECVEAFIAEHAGLGLRYLFESEQGLSAARNAGVRVAKGEILAFIDDDERIVPEWIEAYIELFERYDDAMSAGGPIIAEYPAGRPRWMSQYAEQPIANAMWFGEELRLFPKGRIPGGGNMAIRRSALEAVGLFNTSLGRSAESLIGGEECELFERMKRSGMRCYYTPRAVMYHIIPEQKLTEAYFRRLAYNTGVSQRRRAEIHRRMSRLYIGEAAKWVATMLLALLHRPSQSRYLFILRREISRGIFARD